MSPSPRTPPTLLIAQTIGITASAYICGTNASLSFIAVPAIMQSPAPLAAQQWHTIFTRGARIGIPLALVSSLATGYVASQSMFIPLGSSQRKIPWLICQGGRDSFGFKLNVAASVLISGIVPFTFVVIGPVNRELGERREVLAERVREMQGERETTHALIDRWAMLNLARALLLAAGTLCTTVAAVHK